MNQSAFIIKRLATIAMPPAEYEDKNLLRQIASGDTGAFWLFWRSQERGLRRICMSIFRVHEDAEDALHTAMLRAFERMSGRVDEIAHPAAWLRRLTRNVCLEILRRNRRFLANQESYDDMSSERSNLVSTFSESAENSYFRGEAYSQTYKALEKLPNRLRAAALLRFVFQLPHKEIAEYLNLTNENVRKRIQHARSYLQSEMGDEFNPAQLHNVTRPGKRLRNAGYATAIELPLGLLQQNFFEINLRFEASRILAIRDASGVEYDVNALLTARPARQSIKARSLQRYVERYPRGWKNRLKLAELLFGMGEWDLAEEEFRQILAKRPRTIEAAVLLGDMLLLLRRVSEARDAYKLAAGLTRKEATRSLLDGALRAAHEDWDGAVRDFRRATELEPENVENRRRLAVALLETGKPADALMELDRILSSDPGHLHALTASYEPLATLDRWAEAEERTNRSLQSYRYDALSLARAAKLRMRRGLVHGDEGKATRRMLRRLKRQAPTATETVEVYALYYFYKGDWKKAIHTLRDHAEQRPARPAAWLRLGMMLAANGATRHALAAVRRALELDPTDISAQALECVYVAGAGQEQELSAVRARALQRFPARWEIIAPLALAAAEIEDEPALAISLAERAAALAPELAACRLAAAEALLAAGAADSALHELRSARRRIPRDSSGNLASRSALLAASVYESRNDRNRARRWQARALLAAERLKQFDPALAAYRRGIALFGSERAELAAESLRRALDLRLAYPERQAARGILRKIQGLRKRSDNS